MKSAAIELRPRQFFFIFSTKSYFLEMTSVTRCFEIFVAQVGDFSLKNSPISFKSQSLYIEAIFKPKNIYIKANLKLEKTYIKSIYETPY